MDDWTVLTGVEVDNVATCSLPGTDGDFGVLIILNQLKIIISIFLLVSKLIKV